MNCTEFGSFLTVFGCLGPVFGLIRCLEPYFFFCFYSLTLHFIYILVYLKVWKEKFYHFWFFINFAYSEKLVILGCFGPFWVSSKSLIAATNCFLARPNSKHHTGVNWINDRDFLWKINQIFEFWSSLVIFDHFWLFKACFKAYTMLRSIFFCCFCSLTLHWGYIVGCLRILKKIFYYFSLIFDVEKSRSFLGHFLAILGPWEEPKCNHWPFFSQTHVYTL